MICEAHRLHGRPIAYVRDETHKAEFCRKGRFRECPVYIEARENPLACSFTPCHHHIYYPHYLCVSKYLKLVKTELRHNRV